MVKTNDSSTPDDGLSFERLRVGRYAIAFATNCIRIAEDVPPNRGALSNQLRRSAIATMQGVAEGAGRFKPREKAYRYMTAKAECEEAMAHLMALHALGSVGDERYAEVRELAGHITRMLGALIRRWSGEVPSKGDGGGGRGSNAGEEQVRRQSGTGAEGLGRHEGGRGPGEGMGTGRSRQGPD